MILKFITLPKSKIQMNKFNLMLLSHLDDINRIKNKKEKSQMFTDMLKYLDELEK